MTSLKPGLKTGPSLVVPAAFAATGYTTHFTDALAGLPEGFPEALDEPMTWTGAQFTQPSDYVYTLSNSDLQETENALWYFKALGLDGDLISRDNFPLPKLGLQLNKICRDVHHGKGFGLIRGLDVQKYSTEDMTLLYLGIQSYIANRHGRQDRKGNMLVHIVADNSSKLKAGHHRHSTTSIKPVILSVGSREVLPRWGANALLHQRTPYTMS
ncbi:hypothetical protein CDV36_016126 [Fusarium kuroshium]|uniref:TauD/TfdA-like domain-containing protein n=1 Tax=Fusarium kuroshium TaxID=2010991 RepID=A0A3M2QZI3_9HYPO|nr:hypothetical protein CDV36_016126 [Fusarium kuroshium]